jgi:hypothetical protein
MSKIILDDLVNLQNEQSACATINNNNAILEAAIDNTLSRDGEAPNQMEADIDMNSNRILNLPAPLGVDEPLRLQDLADFNDLGVINALPAGGTTGQALTKTSNTDYDVSWASTAGTVSSVGLSMPAEFSVSGSPVTSTGTLTATKANQAANTFYAGPTGGAAAAPAFRVLDSADMPSLTLTGDITGSAGGGSITTTIGPDKVLNSMLAEIADSTIKSNISGSTANPSDNTITAVLDKQLGTTQGTIAYRNATAWVPLTPGTAGQVLQTGGAAANPSWLTAAGSGTVTQVNTAGILTGGPVTTTGTLNVNASWKPSGRITITTAVPVLNATVSGATTVYYTPYIGNLVPIYDGSIMVPTVFAELSQATTDATKSPAAVAASKMYDLFVWSDAGTIRCTRGPAWSTDSSRGYNLTRVNGILLNASAITNGPAASRGTFVGTIRSNASSTIDYIYGGSSSGGTAGFLGLWNMYNRVQQTATTIDSGTSYTYSSATTRQARASAGNQISYIVGLDEDSITAVYTQRVLSGPTAGMYGAVTIGVDSTAGSTAGLCYQQSPTANSTFSRPTAYYQGNPGLGLHFVSANEAGDGTNNATFNGDNNGRLMLTVWN